MEDARKTVLVVEDEALIRMCVVASLEDAGFRVWEAGNSAEALDVLARHVEISVLVTDVRMPGKMDGLALVAQVYLDHPEVRAIVVSANATADDASDAGAMAFIAKPYMQNTMLRAVNDIVRRH